MDPEVAGIGCVIGVALEERLTFFGTLDANNLVVRINLAIYDLTSIKVSSSCCRNMSTLKAEYH